MLNGNGGGKNKPGTQPIVPGVVSRLSTVRRRETVKPPGAKIVHLCLKAGLRLHPLFNFRFYFFIIVRFNTKYISTLPSERGFYLEVGYV